MLKEIKEIEEQKNEELKRAWRPHHDRSGSTDQQGDQGNKEGNGRPGNGQPSNGQGKPQVSQPSQPSNPEQASMPQDHSTRLDPSLKAERDKEQKEQLQKVLDKANEQAKKDKADKEKADQAAHDHQDYDNMEDLEDDIKDDEDNDCELAERDTAQKSFNLDGERFSPLQIAFATIIGKLAEDNAGEPIEGDEEWDINQLMVRRFSGRGINSCRQTRTKQSIILQLDTSPSCQPQSKLFADIAKAASYYKDVEIWDVPNGSVHSTNGLEKQGKPNFKNTEEQKKLAGYGWTNSLKGRHILVFSDYDCLGANLAAGHNNKIYHFNCYESSKYESSKEDKQAEFIEIWGKHPDGYGYTLGNTEHKIHQLPASYKAWRCRNMGEMLKIARKLR